MDMSTGRLTLIVEVGDMVCITPIYYVKCHVFCLNLKFKDEWGNHGVIIYRYHYIVITQQSLVLFIIIFLILGLLYIHWELNDVTA